MPLDSYTGLKAEIADWLDDDGLADKIDTFIDIAEARFWEELRIREMMQRQTAPLSTTERYLSLPTGFRKMRQLRLLTTPKPAPLDEVTERQLNDRICATAGQPRFFSVEGEIEFDRVANQAYSAEMKFYGALTPLSEDNETNGLFLRAPDIYLWGALAMAEPWLENDPRIATWNGFYVERRDKLNANDREMSGPLVSRVKGSTP